MERLCPKRDGAENPLENQDCVAYAYEVFHPRGPSLRAERSHDWQRGHRFGIVGAMNADARFVQTHPEDADEIVWARLEVCNNFPCARRD